MDLRQLKYFVMIAERGSFSAAAGVLYIAQSALSRQMRLLEEELGGQLFERGSRGVVVSESGKVLLSHARFILTETEDARNDVLAHHRELRGTVRLGGPSSITQILYAPLANRFLDRFPKVQLHLLEGLTLDLCDRVLKGLLDVAIVTEPRPDEHLEFIPLVREQMILVGRAGDPLLAKASVPLERILDLPLILPPSASWLLALERRFGPRYKDLRAVLHVDSAVPLKQLIASGRGYGVVPSSVIQGALADQRLAVADLKGFDASRMLAISRGRPRSRAVRELIQAVQSELTELIRIGLIKAGSRRMPRSQRAD